MIGDEWIRGLEDDGVLPQYVTSVTGITQERKCALLVSFVVRS